MAGFVALGAGAVMPGVASGISAIFSQTTAIIGTTQGSGAE